MDSLPSTPTLRNHHKPWCESGGRMYTGHGWNRKHAPSGPTEPNSQDGHKRQAEMREGSHMQHTQTTTRDARGNSTTGKFNLQENRHHATQRGRVPGHKACNTDRGTPSLPGSAKTVNAASSKGRRNRSPERHILQEPPLDNISGDQ